MYTVSSLPLTNYSLQKYSAGFESKPAHYAMPQQCGAVSKIAMSNITSKHHPPLLRSRLQEEDTEDTGNTGDGAANDVGNCGTSVLSKEGM